MAAKTVVLVGLIEMLNILIYVIYIIISDLGLWTWSTPNNTGGYNKVNFIIYHCDSIRWK